MNSLLETRKVRLRGLRPRGIRVIGKQARAGEYSRVRGAVRSAQRVGNAVREGGLRVVPAANSFALVRGLRPRCVRLMAMEALAGEMVREGVDPAEARERWGMQSAKADFVWFQRRIHSLWCAGFAL